MNKLHQLSNLFCRNLLIALHILGKIGDSLFERIGNHVITYSLEKAVAYFSKNMEGDQQVSAKEIAELVELIHLSAENNRASETEVYLQEYFELANTYREGL